MYKLIATIAFIFTASYSIAQKGDDAVIYRTTDSANNYTLRFSNAYKNSTELIIQTRKSRHQSKYIVNAVRSTPYQLVMVADEDSAASESMILILKVPENQKKFLADKIEGDFVSEKMQRPIVFSIKGLKFRKPQEDISKK